MAYFVKSGNPENRRVACIIVGIFDRRSATDAVATIAPVSAGALVTILRRADMAGNLGTPLTSPTRA